MLAKKLKKEEGLREVIDSLDIKSDVVLVKPNWVGAFPGGYTGAKVVDLLLSALKNHRVIFVESYSFWRTDKKINGTGDYFSSKEATVETGKQHWDFFKKMDEWFLKETGIGDVLKRHGAEYLSVTDEVWKGKGVEPEIISSIVEKQFKPVAIKEMYKMIPGSIFEFKGAPFISLAKAKIDSAYGGSFSIKNIFGLIPDPNRYEKYHGGDTEKILTKSIIDTHKIYQSLFDVKFMVESIFEYCKMNWKTEKSQKIKGDGYIIASQNGFEVDRAAENYYNAKMIGPLEKLLDDYNKVFR